MDDVNWEAQESSYNRHYDPYPDLKICCNCCNYAQEDKETCVECDTE